MWLRMLYILYGPDDFSRTQALKQIREEAGFTAQADSDYVQVDGEELKLVDLTNLCSTIPFLSPRRLVIVRNLLKRFEKKGSGRQRERQASASRSKVFEEWCGLSSYITQMPVTTILVLDDGELRPDNAGIKLLAPLAEVRVFQLLKGRELQDWVRRSVVERGGTISGPAVRLITGAIGGDLWAMTNEIEKLLLYCLGRGISEDDVKRLVSQSREPNTLFLVDAILEGKTQVALRLLHETLREGVSPMYLLVALGRQLGLIVRAKDLPRELPRAEAQKKLGLVKDYPFDKTVAQAKSYSLERLREAYHELVGTDVSIKTGRCDAELALDLLVSKLGRRR